MILFLFTNLWDRCCVWKASSEIQTGCLPQILGISQRGLKDGCNSICLTQSLSVCQRLWDQGTAILQNKSCLSLTMIVTAMFWDILQGMTTVWSYSLDWFSSAIPTSFSLNNLWKLRLLNYSAFIRQKLPQICRNICWRDIFEMIA